MENERDLPSFYEGRCLFRFNGHIIEQGARDLDFIHQRRRDVLQLKLYAHKGCKDKEATNKATYLLLYLFTYSMDERYKKETEYINNPLEFYKEIMEAYNDLVIDFIEKYQELYTGVDFRPLYLGEIPLKTLKTKSAAKST